MHCIKSLGLALLVAGTTPALAQFPPQPAAPKCASPAQGTEQERAACHPDVTRFCNAELTTNECDVFAILSCLQRNRASISAACRAVLTRNGQ
jgi:hypothetical protein